MEIRNDQLDERVLAKGKQGIAKQILKTFFFKTAFFVFPLKLPVLILPNCFSPDRLGAGCYTHMINGQMEKG